MLGGAHRLLLGSRIPRTIECELTKDNVDTCVPGDIVIVSGEVKVVSTDEGKKKREQSMFLLYLLVNSIVKCVPGQWHLARVIVV